MKGLSLWGLFLWPRQTHTACGSTYLALRQKCHYSRQDFWRLRCPAAISRGVLWGPERQGTASSVAWPTSFGSCPQGETAAWGPRANLSWSGRTATKRTTQVPWGEPPARLSQVLNDKMTREGGQLSPGSYVLFMVKSLDSTNLWLQSGEEWEEEIRGKSSSDLKLNC